MELNRAFFKLYENLFIVILNELGEDKALLYFRKIMEKGLKDAYDAMNITGKDIESFIKTVSLRDSSVGLRVKLENSEDKSIYTFFDDPFPGLKNLVDHRQLDDTYMRFKVNYLLGENWKYACNKHFWNGDRCNKFTISKI